MADWEKTENLIATLQMAINVIERWVPIYEQYNTPAAIQETIELLKAQEPVKPVPDTRDGARPWWFVCGNCKVSVDEDQKHCPNCGRAVKW